MLNDLKKGVVVVVAIVALVLGLSFSVMAQGSGQAERLPVGQVTVSGAVMGISFSAAEQAAALGYWSKDRVAAATPLVVANQTGDSTPVADAPAALGPLNPGATLPGGPAADADRQARRDYPREWAAMDAAIRDEIRNTPAWIESPAALESPAAAEGTSATFTSYIINQQAGVQKNFPHRVAGKFTFNTPQGPSS